MSLPLSKHYLSERSPFAWYQVSGAITVASNTQNITTVASTVGDVTLKADWGTSAEVAKLSNLVLTDNALATFVINSQGQLVPATVGTNYAYATLQVTIGYASGKSADDYKPFKGSYTASVTATSTNNRIKLGAFTGETPTYADAANNVITFGFAIDADGAFVYNNQSAASSFTVTGIVVRVDGGNKTGTITDDGDLSAASDPATPISGTVQVATALA